MAVENRGKRQEGLLSPAQQKFVEVYLRTLSARRAAREAGYTDDHFEGWRLLRNERVVKAIEKGKEALRRRNEHLEDEALRQLAMVAFSDISDVVEAGGEAFNVKNLDDLPDSVRAAVKKVTFTPGKHGDRIQVEMHDKLRAIEMLGKFFDMWKESIKVEGGETAVKHEHKISHALLEDRIRSLKGEKVEEFDDL